MTYSLLPMQYRKQDNMYPKKKLHNVSKEKHLGEGNGNPLQYSFLEKSMDRGVWWAEVDGIT